MTSKGTPQHPASVLIVDDSRTMRMVLRSIIESDERLVVIGEASDPYLARDAIKATDPDVITLDVEMPCMNGLLFLEHLMRLRPMPCVLVSNRAQDNSDVAIRALALGAIDCVDLTRFRTDRRMTRQLIETLIAAANARVEKVGVPRRTHCEQERERPYGWNRKIVLIGSSTGGVDALARVLAAFPEDGPPTVVAQHMPASFLQSFARRLDGLVRPRVWIADERRSIRQGDVAIAAGGDLHATLSPGSRFEVVPATEDSGSVHTPSVDLLFRSACPHARNTVAVLLTGMGRDCAAGMKKLRDRGAVTLAQSGETCVVDGMPRAARQVHAVTESIPLQDLGHRILQLSCRLSEPWRETQQ